VKTLRLEYRGDPEMRARFRREARLLQFLSHPNVIRALAFSEERGAPWLVLERIRGRSLREEIAMSAPFAAEDVVPLLQGLATALDHLHARGLAHLDVRPENVIITPDGEVKLIDFGVAQAAGSMQAFADGSRPDNIAYLAPEQVCGEPVSPATDVFALGCVVYELLAGRPPLSALASSRRLCRLRLSVVAMTCRRGWMTSCWARSSAIPGSAMAAPDHSRPFFTRASRGISTWKPDGRDVASNRHPVARFRTMNRGSP
jgi:serine/threonine protein kinase